MLEYSAIAEQVRRREGIYKRVGSELGIIHPTFQRWVWLSLLLLMVVGVMILYSGRPVLGYLCLIVAIAAAPAMHFLPPEKIFDESWEVWPGDFKSSFELAHSAAEFFTFALFIFGVGSLLNGSGTKAIVGIGGALVMVAILNTIVKIVKDIPASQAARDRIVIDEIDRQKPGFREFYNSVRGRRV